MNTMPVVDRTAPAPPVNNWAISSNRFHIINSNNMRALISILVMITIWQPTLPAASAYSSSSYRHYPLLPTPTPTTTTTTTAGPIITNTTTGNFSGPFISGKATCVGCFSSALGCDWPIANLPTPSLQPNDDEGCAALCLVNTQCTHYTFSVFSTSSGLGLCGLKSITTGSPSLTPILAKAPFNATGSSCGWMFGRSAQIPTTATATATASRISNNKRMRNVISAPPPPDASTASFQDVLQGFAKMQNPRMRLQSDWAHPVSDTPSPTHIGTTCGYY